MPQKYDAIIADPDSATRMRLKQATFSAYTFDKVQQVATLDQITSLLSGSNPCDVVFVSYRFDRQEITSFVKHAKETPQGQDAAYVLVLQSNSQDSATIGENVMIGADGFLFEPYSVESLLEITRLAAAVKKERTSARQAAALKIIITDVMNRIDLIAYLKATDHEVSRHRKELSEKCEKFKSLDQESIGIYWKLALELFENAPTPRPIPTKLTYSGASNRTKKKMEQKILQNIKSGS